MAPRQFLDSDIQPFARDPPLEFDRKKPIVAPGDHAGRNLGPCFKTAGLTKNDVGLGTLVRLALLDDLGRDVMQEVCGKVEFRSVATPLCSFSACRNRSGAVPPLACRLARK